MKAKNNGPKIFRRTQRIIEFTLIFVLCYSSRSELIFHTNVTTASPPFAGFIPHKLRCLYFTWYNGMHSWCSGLILHSQTLRNQALFRACFEHEELLYTSTTNHPTTLNVTFVCPTSITPVLQCSWIYSWAKEFTVKRFPTLISNPLLEPGVTYYYLRL